MNPMGARMKEIKPLTAEEKIQKNMELITSLRAQVQKLQDEICALNEETWQLRNLVTSKTSLYR